MALDDAKMAPLIALRLDRTPHSGRSLLAHLTGVYRILKRWGEREAICLAGLYHSIYGTQAFRVESVPLSHRSQIAEVIGAEAERLSYLFCAMERRRFWEDLERPEDPSLSDRYTGEVSPLSRQDLRDLVVLLAANMVEQRPRLRPAEWDADHAHFAAARALLGPVAAADLDLSARSCDMRYRLSDVLANRRFCRRADPFPHFVVQGAFVPAFHRALEDSFQAVLSRGLSNDTGDPTRFSRNMAYSDAYAWNFPPDVDGPIALFYSREWHDMLAQLTGVACTGDVNGALHHHQLQSKDGSVHTDVGVGWFSSQPRSDGINPMDLRRCTYTHGKTPAPEIQIRETVRAVTMIYYLGNPGWSQGDGGETGLYRTADAAVNSPAALVPPIDNSILIFENHRHAFHSFLHNPRRTRNSAILWLHRDAGEVKQRWGGKAIGRW